MSRRLASVAAFLLLTATAATAQVPFTSDLIPTPTALARLGLKRQWFGVVPLHGTERVSEVSLDKDLVFVQTTDANFHAFQAETGRLLWSAKIGLGTPKGLHSSTNSYAVYVTNSNELFALSRKTGTLIWKAFLPASAASPTACDEERVFVGLLDGKLDVRTAAKGEPLWQAQTFGTMVARPLPAGKVVAFADAGGKVYVSLAAKLAPLIRWSAVGPIHAPMTSSGARTLIVASMDRSIYSVDLFKGETNWTFPTGAPISLEPLVTDEDVYVVNTEGSFSSLDINTGSPRWTISTLGGPLLGVTNKRIYLESRDGDMFIVDRKSGSMLHDTRSTHFSSGVNIRPFEFGPTNRLNDRLYLGTKSGLLVCLREIDQVQPRPLVDPKAKPLGYIPPEGYQDFAPKGPAPLAAPAEDPAAPAPAENNGDTPK